MLVTDLKWITKLGCISSEVLQQEHCRKIGRREVLKSYNLSWHAKENIVGNGDGDE